MGDSKDSFSKPEAHETKLQPTVSLYDAMSCKESLEILRKSSISDVASPCDYLPTLQLSEAHQKTEVPQGSRIQHFEKRGQIELSVTDRGEVVGVKDGQHTLRKFGDQWLEDFDGGRISKEVKDVQVNKDGSYSFTTDLGKFSYDAKGQLTEAPAGHGSNRKFHYTDGQLDQIDGKLGHWDRVVKDGHVSWVNKNGTVWHGDFKMNGAVLEFQGENGVAWGFTAQGRDIQIKPTEKHPTDHR